MSLPPLWSLAITMVHRPMPWKKDRFVPAVIFLGKDPEVQAANFVSGVMTEVPYADVSSRAEPASVRELIDLVAGEQGDLGSGVPRSLLPAPRFALTQIILMALKHGDEQSRPGSGAGNGSLQSADLSFREALREWRRDRTPMRSWGGRLEYAVRFLGGPTIAAAVATVFLTETFNTVGLTNVFILCGALVVALGIAWLLAQAWSSGTYRNGWFSRQPYVPRRRREKIESYLRRVADRAREDPGVVDRLLLHAFIEDLRLAYNRRRPWPGWGRNAYAVLVLGDVGDGGRRQRFLTVMHEVLMETGKKVPLLVVGYAARRPSGMCATSHAAAEPLVIPPNGDLAATFDAWQDRTRRLAPCPYVYVDSDALPDGHAAPQPVKRGAAFSRRRPIAYWLAVSTVILLPVVLGGWRVLRPCEPGLTNIEGQCVGVSTAVKNFHPALAPILSAIVRENEGIPSDAKPVRVIFFGPLTSDPSGHDPGRNLAGIAAELAGLYARQKTYNALKNDWKIYVEFANPGHEYRHARHAAEKIAERAAGDRSVAAVVGFGWSRKEAQDALGVLCGVPIPVISTAATADALALVDAGPNDEDKVPARCFYRLSPANSKQALVAVDWLGKGLPRAPGKTIEKNPRVGVVEQSDNLEIYSADLAREFNRLYQGEKMSYRFSLANELKEKIRQACSEDKVKVLYYTGRADHLPTLQDAWSSFCASEGVVILAGDDVTRKVATDVNQRPKEHNLDLRFISLSDPGTDGKAQEVNSDGRAVRTTLEEIEKRRAEEVADGSPAAPAPLPIDHALLAYDAARVVTTAFDAIRLHTDDMDVRAGLQDHLRGLKVTGATGEIEFHASDELHNAHKRELWKITVFPEKELTVEEICTPSYRDPGCESAGAAAASPTRAAGGKAASEPGRPD